MSIYKLFHADSTKVKFNKSNAFYLFAFILIVISCLNVLLISIEDTAEHEKEVNLLYDINEVYDSNVVILNSIYSSENISDEYKEKIKGEQAIWFDLLKTTWKEGDEQEVLRLLHLRTELLKEKYKLLLKK